MSKQSIIEDVNNSVNVTKRNFYIVQVRVQDIFQNRNSSYYCCWPGSEVERWPSEFTPNGYNYLECPEIDSRLIVLRQKILLLIRQVDLEKGRASIDLSIQFHMQCCKMHGIVRASAKVKDVLYISTDLWCALFSSVKSFLLFTLEKSVCLVII